MASTPYQTLGIEPNATQDRIKSAYRKLAKQLHPDLNPGNKVAESRFKEIASAYEQINTAENRAKYDRGEVEAEATRQNAARSRGPFYSETQTGGGRYSNQFAGMDDESLRSFFDQMGQASGNAFHRQAEEKTYQLEIEFKDSILGGEKEMVFPDGKKLLVKIPAGINTGTKLRFAGRGEPDFKGGPPRDIFVQLSVKKSPTFRRVGKDLEVDITISFSDAILGAEVRVPTVDGAILMKIPANVKSDQKVRLKGKGVPDSNTQIRGDQIAILKIVMPDNIDDEFRKAVEDWSRRQVKESV